jgi:hypothetical protein
MPEPINFETKNDRELLIVLAQSFNSLNEQTVSLCMETENLKQIAYKNKEKLQDHEIKLIEIVNDNSRITRETTETLKTMNTLLTLHSKELNDLDIIRKFFWWVVGAVGVIVTAILIFLIEHRIVM